MQASDSHGFAHGPFFPLSGISLPYAIMPPQCPFSDAPKCAGLNECVIWRQIPDFTQCPGHVSGEGELA
jgi:hypothetical protein